MEDGRKYYVLCGDNCKFEGMTKEQIISAIYEAMTTGEIKDFDAGVITKIAEQNRNTGLRFWVGTTAEYNAITKKEDNCLYILTDETGLSDMEAALQDMQKELSAYGKRVALLAQITVKTRYGNLICTNPRGEEIAPSNIKNGVFTYNVNEYGVYTFTGTYKDMTRIATVDVKAVQQYETSIEYYDDDFSKNSWETIVEVINNGEVPETWAVGDRNVLTTIDGKEYDVTIIGKNHDDIFEGGKAPFTFSLQILNERSMHNGNECLVGWSGCDARLEKIPEVFMPTVPEFLLNAMKTVTKITATVDYNGAIAYMSGIIGTQDKIFLLSEYEIKGEEYTKSFGYEGEQYEYFKNGNKLVENDDKSYYWLRSLPRENASSYFCVSSKDNTIFTNPCNRTYFSSTTTMKMAAAFCL